MKLEDIKPGTPVIYWGVIKDSGQRFDPFKTVITSEPWQLGHGEVVCKIAGRSGGHSIRHLDKVTPGSLMAAKVQGLEEVSMEDIKRATKEYFAVHGVEIEITE